MTFRHPSRNGLRVLALLAIVMVLLATGKVLFERHASTVSGMVYDEYTGTPVAGARVQWDILEEETDEAGEFTLIGVNKALRDKPIVVTADEYAPMEVSSDQEEASVHIRPNTVSGRLLDEAGEPVVGVQVVSGSVSAKTDDEGGFRLKGVSPDPVIQVRAPGYQVVTFQTGRQQWVEIQLKTFVARGLYIGFGTFALSGYRDAIIRKAERFGLNAIVLDIKSDRGFVNSVVATPLSEEIGASVEQPYDLEVMVRALKERGFYTIARLVVFKDAFLVLANPDIAVKENGNPYLDCEEQYWLDPFSEEAWDYNLDLAENAAGIGFDEIHFDYIRFPSDCILGPLTYMQRVTPESQQAAINGFLEQASQRLSPLGVYLSAAVFGLATVDEDIGIGQLLEGVAQHVDYVSPMVYPSTWRNGAFGADYPPAEPYRIVKLSVGRAVERLEDTPARVRPWLQAFDDYKEQHLSYNWPEVEAQMKAAQEAGALGWLLWDPFGEYPLAGSLP